MASNLVVRDVDLRVLAVLILATTASEIGGAVEFGVITIIGLMVAFLTTPDTQEIVNAFVESAENYLYPITKTTGWKIYGQPFAYFSFLCSITVLLLA